ncbi:hypothetical protein CH063_07519 [Colletotrichum higginsianum]|uniref:Uncharacterized protein n=1 Tax=Colletotrichum higginsianum (strain IMI 349063) TaxID=759273 RepID=H1V6F9_COLHI|nr:hypothetical protein CH063_07519 [Colletotrichum higginsianum]
MFLDTAEAIDGQWILKNRPSARISPRDPKPPFHRFAEIQGEQRAYKTVLFNAESLARSGGCQARGQRNPDPQTSIG